MPVTPVLATAPIPRRRRRERGASMVLVGLSLVMLLTFTALAVDIGVGAARTRDLQQVADLVALDAARILDGSALPAGFDAQVMASAARNGFPVSGTYSGGHGVYTDGNRRLDVDLGCWIDPDGAGPSVAAFVDGCASPDAVLVEAADTVDYTFADVIGVRDARFDRDATAALVPTVDAGIGSVGVGLQQQLDAVSGSVHADAYVQALNARLRAAFDTDAAVTPPPNGVGLDILAWRGITASDVSWGELASNAGFASPEELADATITNGQLFEATARALEAEGNGVAASDIRSFAGRSDFDSDGTMQLGGDDGPFQFEQGTGTAQDPGAADARVNVADLLIGAASVVDGRNFVRYEITPNVPGVVSVRVDTRIVEPMQWRYDARVGQSVDTAQIRQQLTLTLDPTHPTLSALGVTGDNLRLPIVVEGATAQATVADLRCFEPATTSEAVLDAVTSLARFHIGVAQNLQAEGNPALDVQSGTVISAAGVTLTTLIELAVQLVFGLGNDITGGGTVSLGGGSSSHTFFPDATPNPPQRAQGGVSANVGTELQQEFDGNLNDTGDANLANSLSAVFNDLGAGIIDPALHAAGITIGGADIVATDISCLDPQLVA